MDRKISQKQTYGTTREFEDTCDLLLQCTGVLSFPKLPNIPGLEKFKGKVRSNYQIAEVYLIAD
jgi:cation diffusion facilitator CzcD-associated flavoprotein CzcO